MKRSLSPLASALIIALLAGCDGGGIEEGMSTEGATASGQPAGFEEMMRKNADMMKMKNQQRKPVPKAPPG